MSSAALLGPEGPFAREIPNFAPRDSQQRMAACAAQNKGKKGADYKAAQSACLKKS